MDIPLAVEAGHLGKARDMFAALAAGCTSRSALAVFKEWRAAAQPGAGQKRSKAAPASNAGENPPNPLLKLLHCTAWRKRWM